MQTETEIRNLIIDSGHKLLKEELVSRTWGNISARLDEKRFIITPSGRDYLSLRPEELVIVDIATLSHEGDIKPSSEKGIHAAIYAQHPEINFVIHTHQFYACAISAETVNKRQFYKHISPDGFDAIRVPYAMPGTKALCKNFTLAMKEYPDTDEFILSRHGAVVFAANADEAFNKASALELRCKAQYEKLSRDVSRGRTKKPWLDDYAQLVWLREKKECDDMEAARLIMEKNAAAARYVHFSLPLPHVDAGIQKLVYQCKYSKLK